ncbi:hypothetical protein CP556_19955 [Natrinema sp. CBA1119]|nr:hypothetical protein CP556_19955 [Natrinema sp. CBA1119]
MARVSDSDPQRWPTPRLTGSTPRPPAERTAGEKRPLERVTDLYERVLERFDEHPDRVSFLASRNR